MSKSITFHNGTTLSQQHNRRNEKYTNKQKHIDKNRKNENIIFVDRNIKDVYEELFSESVAEYNAKQKRSDRKIKDYYQKVKDDKQKNLCYECIVQIGTKEDTSYSSTLEKQALKQFVEEWETRNPNLKLVGAYMHNDEGTSHLHIDYIPVCYNNKRGMKIQNSFLGALREQKIVEENTNCTAHCTAQMLWEQSERQALEIICKSLNIDAKANQGLCRTKYFDARTGEIKVGTRKHLSVEEYKQARQEMLSDVRKEKAELQQENSKLQKEIKRKTDILNMEKAEIPEIPETITVKNLFGKEKTRSLTEEERTLKEQERNNLIKQNELHSQLLLLQERERIVQAQEEEQQVKIKKQNAELEQISNDIQNLQAKRANLQSDINSLQTEKANLKANIADIKADAIHNALVNVNVLNAYYVNSDAYMTKFRAYNDTIEKGDKQYAKNNKNAEYGDNS